MIIQPNHGVDELFFGMRQAEARTFFQDEPESFKRTENAEWPCDYFASQGLFIYYKAPGLVEAIELCEPSSAILDGFDLLRSPVSEVLLFLQSRDEELEVTDDSFTSYKLGVGGFVPEMQDGSATVEAVIVFPYGYYG